MSNAAENVIKDRENSAFGCQTVGCGCEQERIPGSMLGLTNRGMLEIIPIIVGVGLHTRAVVCQRYQCMAVQQYGVKVARERLPIDIDLPSTGIG